MKIPFSVTMKKFRKVKLFLLKLSRSANLKTDNPIFFITDTVMCIFFLLLVLLTQYILYVAYWFQALRVKKGTDKVETLLLAKLNSIEKIANMICHHKTWLSDPIPCD